MYPGPPSRQVGRSTPIHVGHFPTLVLEPTVLPGSMPNEDRRTQVEYGNHKLRDQGNTAVRQPRQAYSAFVRSPVRPRSVALFALTTAPNSGTSIAVPTGAVYTELAGSSTTNDFSLLVAVMIA